ncbi:MAG: hypothetical protein AB7U73_18015 [Pirellulales bacterium]
MTEETPSAPARPRKLKARYEVVGDRLRISRYYRHWGGTAFLAVWLAFWTIGCMALVGMLLKVPTLMHLLFAIPFWASWFFVAAILVGMLRFSEEFELDLQGARHRSKALVELSNRIAPLWELQDIEVSCWTREKSNGPPDYGIQVRTWGRPLRILAGLPELELRWLAHQLTQLLATLQAATATSQSRNRATDFAGPDELPKRLVPSDHAIEPPSDCQWTLSHELNALVFTSRGRWSWIVVGFVLFLNCFWNGIVSVFLLPALGLADNGPQDWERIQLLLFLIPFELVGLLMMVVLAIAIAEPLRSITWRFTPTDLKCELQWRELGRRWSYAIKGLSRIELDRKTDAKRKLSDHFKQPNLVFTNDECPYRLSFVDRDNAEVCEIAGLSEGEARWIADQVMRHRREWFR